MKEKKMTFISNHAYSIIIFSSFIIMSIIVIFAMYYAHEGFIKQTQKNINDEKAYENKIKIMTCSDLKQSFSDNEFTGYLATLAQNKYLRECSK